MLDLNALYNRANELSDYLSRCEIGSQEYDDVSKELSVITGIIGDAEKRDLNRLDIEGRRESEGMKVAVDARRVSAMREAEWLGFGRTILGVTAAGLLGCLSYWGEADGRLSLRGVWDAAKRLLPRI